MTLLLVAMPLGLVTRGSVYEHLGETEMEMISQSQWGSTLEYSDYALRGSWDPQYIIVHWGGNTRERDTFEEATATLRSWQRMHRRKGWQDIGYNYAIDELGNMYRLRGENHAGHTSGKDPITGKGWGTVGVGIVWIGGAADEDGPSALALARLDRYVKERGLPVLGHVETGKATSCPGPFLLDYINNGVRPPVLDTTEEHMLISRGHPVGATVGKIQDALIRWEANALPRWGADEDFGGETETWVKNFQESAKLSVTGKVDDETAYLLS